MRPPTAYQWPAIDMFPYFLIRTGEASLSSDFFSQCSVLPSPRHIFGAMVLSLAASLRLHWYAVLYLIQCLVSVLTPAAMFLALVFAVRRLSIARLTPAFPVVLALLIIFGEFNPHFFETFALGWWPAYITQATPHAVSQLVSALAIPLLLARSRHIFALGCTLAAAGVLLHPTVGASAAGVAAVVLSIETQWKRALVVVGSVFGAAIAIVLFYAEPSHISALEFVRIYARGAHPSHYIPSQFAPLYVPAFLAAFIGIHWYTPLAATVICLTAAAFLFHRTAEAKLAKFCMAAVAVLVGLILLQYCFVEIHPIKIVATIGPSTALLWNFWLFAMSMALLCDWIFVQIRQDALPVALFSSAENWWSACSICFGAVLGVLLSFISHDQLASTPMARNGPVLTWIKSHTPEDAVFMVPQDGDWAFDIPIVAHRGVFFGNGFPFTERCFRGYEAREQATFGTPEQVTAAPGAWIGAKYEALYDAHSELYFASLRQKWKLDYVIVRKGVATSLFHKAPSFSTADFSIYELR